MTERNQRPGALVGTALEGGYQLTRLVGEGGMGAVYEGTQVRLNRRVAVKVMARDLAGNPEALARFRREVHITTRLAHPHIVQVLDVGTTPDGLPFLVMELLEGEDLERRLKRVRWLPLARVVQVVDQVASALAATHRKGIVHRDLKPANVFLLDAEGVSDFVKVLDFGISKTQSSGAAITQGSVMMGTPKYMAPEQIIGRRKVDQRADQWALACIAWEALTGRPPFAGKDVAAILYQVVHGDPPRLAEEAPDLPPDVEVVLRRALSKRAGDRFATMAAFARALAVAAQPPRELPAPTTQPSIPVFFDAPPDPAPGLLADATRWLRRLGTPRPPPPPPPRRGRVASTLVIGRRALEELLASPRKPRRSRWVALAAGATLLVGGWLALRGGLPSLRGAMGARLPAALVAPGRAPPRR
jgi:serine/threonine protein kinase